MLDLFTNDQQDLLSPNNGQLARQAQPSMAEAYQATSEANARVNGMFSETANQHDFLQSRLDDFQAKTGTRIENPYGLDDGGRAERFKSARDQMAKVALDQNDPGLNFPTDDEIAKGGLGLARRAVQRQAELSQGPTTLGSMLGSTAASAVDSATDPLNIISLAAAPEGGALLASALRVGGAMGAQTLIGDVGKYSYRQRVNPDYGVGDVAADVAGAAAGGALFGAGHALGGEGVKAALGAAAGGAVGGAALGGIQGGATGALQGALGGAAIPLAGAGFGLSAKTLGMGWRVLRETNPEAAAAMPLDVRDAGAVAEKAGDLQAQNPFRGPNADAAHADAIAKVEDDLINSRTPEVPQSAQIEAASRRGQVFYPGGAIDARYDLAEHADLITSHDADFNVNPNYPPELQPRDRAGAPAQDQVNSIAANLAPDRLGPSPEANSGAPIVGPDGVVESGNGRVLAIGRAYDQGGGAAGGYRQWLEQQGFDTSGYDKPVLVGVRETPMDAGQRADFAHAANASASLRMSATEQALSDARALDSSTIDLAQHPDPTAAANRDFVRAFVAKLPQGERGGMLTRDGGLSANGARRLQAAMAARAYGDPGVLARMVDDPDPNIKAIAGAMTDAAGPWARMRDAATRGDIAAGHDITSDMLQAVKAIMRARDEKRPLWEVLNQGDMFLSDTTQLASRLFFRDEEMRQPAGRARIAEALATYAQEASKNTIGGRLFADDVPPVDVLRTAARLRDVSTGLKADALELLRRGTETQPADAAETAQRSALPKDIVDAVDGAAAQDGSSDAPGQSSGRERTGGEVTPGDDGAGLLGAGEDGGRAAGNTDAAERLSSGYPTELSASRSATELASPADVLSDFGKAIEGGTVDARRFSEAPTSDQLDQIIEAARAFDSSEVDRVFGDDADTARKLMRSHSNSAYDKLSDLVEKHGSEAEKVVYGTGGAHIADVDSLEALRKRISDVEFAVDQAARGDTRDLARELAWIAPRLPDLKKAAASHTEDERIAVLSLARAAEGMRENGIDPAPVLRDAVEYTFLHRVNKDADDAHLLLERLGAYAKDVFGDSTPDLIIKREPLAIAPSPRLLSERELTGRVEAAAQDVIAKEQQAKGDLAARQVATREPSLEQQPFTFDDSRTGLEVRNIRTGEEVQAQSVSAFRDVLSRSSVAGDANADPLARLTQTAIGSVLEKIAGDTPVYVVGPVEMRTLASGRMRVAPGYEPAGFYDPAQDHIVVLDDAMRDRSEGSRLLMHEGMHSAFMQTINESENARSVIDQLRTTAAASHLDRGGNLAEHYGLTNAHEFVSEAFSNPDFQRFLASVPADDRIVRAFGLDQLPGQSLWDAFVGAVRKILGMQPDQQSLLEAAMRLGQMLDEARTEALRGGPDDIAPSVRLADADARAEAAQEAYAKARQFADARDAIAYRINTDRIQQHPKGPLAGFLGILTRDIHENGGINVESVTQDYEGRMADAMEKIVEPYGSKLAGMKQDITGIRDVIREIFGVDTKNPVAKIAGEAWGKGVDKAATDEAKRLGKVFTPAEDWRVPQFWESSRAQKFGKRTLLADLQSEIDAGGLKVFDPDTGEEANALRRAEILNGVADKIVTDASLGGTHGGAFKTDMRVFRFADGERGAQSYLKLMDKYGAGQGGYLQMFQAHVGKVSRELALSRVLGPGWAENGEQLLQDALLAAKTIKANRERPEGLVDRLKALPGDTGRFLTSWLESPAKAEAVWQYMSGQAIGVGSELMAGLLSETRAFMTSTRMGSALVTAVPADTVNWLMAARHNGLDMGRMVTAITDAFIKDNPERREEAARLGIVAHAGADAAIGTKRFGDQVVGEKLWKRMADFIIRAQGLHAWDSAIKRAFPMEFLGTIAQRGGKAFADLDEPFANFLKHYAFTAADWSELSKVEHALPVGEAKFLQPDKLPEPLRVKLMSAIYDERQFAYLAGGSTRVKAVSASAKAGTLPGELARSVFLFKSFPMSMLATWGMRSAREIGAGRYGTAATLVTGMTMAGALSMQARAVLQGKDPRNMKDPFFWGESFLQGGAAGIYGDFFKEAFSRSDTSMTETMMGPLAAIPAGIQGLTSGARRMAEDGQHVNFGAKVARLLSQNVVGGNLWYGRLVASRLLFDNIQRLLDRDYAKSFARQQERSIKTNHQGFFWAPGQNAPSRAPDLGAMTQSH